MRSVETSSLMVDEEDRISKLPEDVIIFILSFLETRYTVQTSALSKRWKNLYNSVPSIIFNLAYIDTTTDAGLNFLKQSISFIDRRLNSLHCGHLIHKFIFTCRNDVQVDADEHVKDWLSVVTKAGIQQLCLDIPEWEAGQNMAEIFNCESLVELKLGHKEEGMSCFSGITLYLPGLIHLPNLKSFHLCLEEINIDVAEGLFTNFPQLQSLTLIANCFVSGKITFNISCPNLKHLVFEFYCILEDNKYEVVIDAPVLATLSVDGCLESFIFTNPPSLEEACIGNSRVRCYCRTESDLLGLLEGISSVKYLQVTALAYKVIGYCKAHSWLFFPNLTWLKLTCIENSTMLELLRHAPNLEYLKLIVHGWCDREFDSDDDDDVPSCLLSHMKVIEVEYNGVWSSHLVLAEYLLKKAKVLSMMVFDCESMYDNYAIIMLGDAEDPEDYLHDMKSYRTEVRAFQTKILGCPRASQTCQIEFLGAMDTYPLEELW